MKRWKDVSGMLAVARGSSKMRAPTLSPSGEKISLMLPFEEIKFQQHFRPQLRPKGQTPPNS